MRNTFAVEMTALVQEHSDVVLLSGDIGNKLFDRFKSIAPDRFYNCGVAEANMTGVGAGLAMMGFKPFTYTITPFATVRCLEQIRVDICYHNVPVTIVGTGAGLSYASLGPTHHSCDDIGFLRLLPNMTILCPCDPYEVRACVRAAVTVNGPVYIRLGKKGEPNIHPSMPDFQIGKSICVREGNDICILSTGNIMAVALSACDLLADQNISVRVESFPTVKPLDTIRLNEIFNHFSVVATIEEHSLIGGFGASVAEWLSAQERPLAKLKRFGTRDEFMPYVGEQVYARDFYDLTAHKIAKNLIAAMDKI